MPIITISRGAFSGGQELAERVASSLGYRCLNREVLAEASRRYGIPEAKFTEVLETRPHWWERWLEGLRLYRIALQAAMCEVAQGGNLVYHGHRAQELFPGIHHVLKVQLTAPLEYRVEQVKLRKKLDEAAARDYIDQVDAARSRRLRALFGTNWRDPTRYDLVLNRAQMTLETAAHLVVVAAGREEYQPTEASEQAFQNFTVTSRVQAQLLTSSATKNLSVQVQVQQGEVRVSAVVSQPEIEEEVVRLIERVPGVVKVVPDFKWIPIMEDMYH